jgi:hypothetical protein
MDMDITQQRLVVHPTAHHYDVGPGENILGILTDSAVVEAFVKFGKNRVPKSISEGKLMSSFESNNVRFPLCIVGL